MARKIKLPLDMGNDIKVRDIDELKENYNSEKVVEYFLSGELLSWLNDRFYDEEAERVEALSADKDSVNVAGELAEIFGVHIEGEVDVDEIAERNERLERLRKITSDDEVLRNVDLVAFSQEDMDIVHESDVIYLCGEKFRIPYSVQNKRYIGVNDPLIEISTSGEIDLEGRGIVIEGCRFTEETEARLQNTSKIVEKGLAYLENKDYINANKYFMEAAEHGDHEAEFQLGKAYEEGIGVEKSIKLARQWYTKAANDGSAKACNNLGAICKENDKNYTEALSWYKKGLEIEERPALLYNLGRAYVSSDFGLCNPDMAERYLLRAAEQDYKPAISELADFYIDDENELYSLEKADQWMSKIMNRADEEDLMRFGDKFADDTKSTCNFEKALKYYEAALAEANDLDPDETHTDLQVKRAFCLYKMGSLGRLEALSIFKKAANEDPPCTCAVEALIDYYEQACDSDSVNKWCRVYADECLDFDEGKNKYIFIAAKSYTQAGKYERALELYSHTTLFCSDDNDILYAYEKMGDICLYKMRGMMSDHERKEHASNWYENALEKCEEIGIDKNDQRYVNIKSKLHESSR